jgi:octaheme c-type cytochrome (tetrathionate reductase family)
MPPSFRVGLVLLLAAAMPAVFATLAPSAPPASAAAAAPALVASAAAPHRSTADHSKFKVLQKVFKTGPEVTEVCLSCHTEAAKQVQHTKHWTWRSTDAKTGRTVGKRAIINNYCTTTISNEKDCMACHAGYGWKDGDFDFSKQENVDCLICHDATGTYRKLPGDAGHPVYERREFPPKSGKFVEAVDLAKVAQSVALPSRSNCGSCHFYGAGGDGTKHGDLDSSLVKPGKYLDVHMDAKGLNFACTTCHATTGHEVAGSRYQLAGAIQGPAHLRGTPDDAPAACQSCHGNRPHPASKALLNDHTETLACQTCHIPEYARDAVGTEMSWDWSRATQMGPDGKPVSVKDSAGHRAFDSKKGGFVWDSYVRPEYRWFDGHTDFKIVGDKIDPEHVVQINTPNGAPGSPGARIWPMKVHRGKQAFDKVNKTLLVVHTAGEDETALWQNYEWDKAIRTGMQAASLPYSGEFGFVSTEMSWPITHMVAPKADAVPCQQCHTQGGRLEGIQGVYLPARDRNGWLDLLGWSAVALAIGASLLHGLARIVIRSRNRRTPS